MAVTATEHQEARVAMVRAVKEERNQPNCAHNLNQSFYQNVYSSFSMKINSETNATVQQVTCKSANPFHANQFVFRHNTFCLSEKRNSSTNLLGPLVNDLDSQRTSGQNHTQDTVNAKQ